MANFFTRLFQKQSQARTALAFNQVGQPQHTPRNYEAFSKEGYQINVIAYKCVSIISRAAAPITWNLFTKPRAGISEPVEISSHPLLDLLNKPNPMQGQSSFFESLIAYYLIAGNSYIESVGTSPTSAPTELWSIRPDRVRIIPGQYGLPQAYEFKSTTKTILFPVDQVTGESQILHLKTFHPTDNWYGMSAIESALYSIDQHNESGKWNTSLLQNMATPSGVITVTQDGSNPMGVLPDTQFENVKDQIKERLEGSKNAGRVLLLEGGMDWKQMGLTPKEMDWIEGRKMASRDIALAFGVPPIILNIPGDSTFNNYREARLSLYEDTILPLLDMIKFELNSWLVPRFGDNIFLNYDVDSITALDTKRSEKFTQISGAGFLTTNEKRIALGYEPIEGGDYLLVNSGQITLDDLVSSEDDTLELPDASQPESIQNQMNDDSDEQDEAESQEPNSESEDEEDSTKNFSHIPIEQLETKQINPIGKSGRISAWKRINTARDRLGEAMELDLIEDFQKMAKQIGKETAKLEPRLAEFAAMNAIEQSSRDIEKTIKKHFRRATEYFGRNILEYSKSINDNFETKTTRRFWDFLDSYIDNHSKSAITSIENTNLNTARKTIRKLTAQSFEEGTLMDLSTELQNKFKSLAPSRAKMIARTEIGIASNDAAIEAVKALDIPDMMKEWVSVQDNRTRPGNFDGGNLEVPNHIVMNGVRVGLNEKFTVPPDASMDGPGDDTAEAGQIINCRCVLIFSRE